MKTQREKQEDILFQSLDKIFDLYGGDIYFDEIVHWVLVRTTNEMLNNCDWTIQMINRRFRLALIECLNFKKEEIKKEIDEQIQKIKNKTFKRDARTY